MNRRRMLAGGAAALPLAIVGGVAVACEMPLDGIGVLQEIMDRHSAAYCVLIAACQAEAALDGDSDAGSVATVETACEIASDAEREIAVELLSHHCVTLEEMRFRAAYVFAGGQREAAGRCIFDSLHSEELVHALLGLHLVEDAT